MHPEELDGLVARSVEYGASNARVIEIKDLVIDERTRLKCQFGCPNYRKNLMCPPYVPGPEEFSKIVSRYSWAILFEFEVPNEEVSEVKGIQKKLQTFIERMELEAMKLGYSFALGLKAGGCTICDRCIAWLGEGNLPCRHPERARPAMEALGIDVIGTLKKIGYEEIPKRLFALLLVD
ncbi:MAG: DUF2284 domain-containing protein [Candidatus Syntrophoarchaeum sp. WYZ-LMO15]|nr:MAG: DUF2284 domain-containing protein [Candidatus Syntrophoarchaeum sp. WYZ-LMO15]